MTAASSALSPISGRERLFTLDVLRGIALLGVVIANVWLWFSGIAFRMPGPGRETAAAFATIGGR